MMLSGWIEYLLRGYLEFAASELLMYEPTSGNLDMGHPHLKLD